MKSTAYAAKIKTVKNDIKKTEINLYETQLASRVVEKDSTGCLMKEKQWYKHHFNNNDWSDIYAQYLNLIHIR